MVFGVKLLEPLACDMRIDLGRGYVGMTKEQLYDAQIGAMINEVRGKRVTDGMR